MWDGLGPDKMRDNIWALRELEYVTSKLKTNKADMFYITAKGKQIKEVLLHEE